MREDQGAVAILLVAKHKLLELLNLAAVHPLLLLECVLGQERTFCAEAMKAKVTTLDVLWSLASKVLPHFLRGIAGKLSIAQQSRLDPGKLLVIVDTTREQRVDGSFAQVHEHIRAGLGGSLLAGLLVEEDLLSVVHLVLVHDGLRLGHIAELDTAVLCR